MYYVTNAKNETIARVAKASKEDVDRAVAAARKAFDHGPWPKMSPYERGRVIQKIADRIRERADEIARVESLNTGKPLARAKGEILGSAMVFDFYAAGDKHYGETLPLGGNIQTRPCAGNRRGRSDRAWNFSRWPLEGPGAGVRLLPDPEASLEHPLSARWRDLLSGRTGGSRQRPPPGR
jgi:hypothetical protein